MRANDFYGNKFKWFVGIVKEAEGGKVRVRCFGVHPFEVDGMGDGPAYAAVSNGDLPYATVVYPVNATAPEHLLQLEDWVYGFFADGDSCQQPVVVGKLGRSDGSNGSSFIGGGGGGGGDSGGAIGGTRVPGNAYKSSGTGPNASINVENYYGYIPGNSNSQKAFNALTTFFMEQGLPLDRAKQVAAGSINSLMYESGKNLDPGALNPSSKAIGIAQWLGPRKRALAEMCQPGDLECQINYMVSELKSRNFGNSYEGKEANALKHLLGASNAADASDIWTIKFERPGYPGKSNEAYARERRGSAYNTYQQLAPNFEPARVGIAPSNGSSGTERF